MNNQRSTWNSIVLLRPLYTEECLETIEKWSGEFSKPNAVNREKDGIRIFRNPFIEHVLAKAHPIIPGLWAIPLAVWGLIRGFTGGHSGVVGTIGLFALGVLLWTLLEYVLHRFLFHITAKDLGGKIRSFMAHGYHHEFPNDKMRLVAPPLMAATLGIGAGLVYFLLFGEKYWLQVFGGTALGYLGYDWIHYYTHHFHPKNRVGKWLRRYHLMHHFQDDNDRYGISSPLWDIIFRTYKAPEKSRAA
jgi:sterol desaturase/sphingolipid hydroxylase (fatty acid hydroxylase superfamily)